MQPSIKRRTFLQLLTLPALAFLRPSAAQAQAQTGIIYTDSEGNTNFTPLHDNNAQTGIEYNA